MDDGADEHDPARTRGRRDQARQYAGRPPGSPRDRGRLKRFDFAVANPPFSDKAWTNGLDPAKNGDFAFLLHLGRSQLASSRTTTIELCPTR